MDDGHNEIDQAGRQTAVDYQEEAAGREKPHHETALVAPTTLGLAMAGLGP
jgi:hypothetical protein